MVQNKVGYDGTDAGASPYGLQYSPHSGRWDGAAFYVVTKDPIDNAGRVFAAIVKALREEDAAVLTM